MQYSEYRITLDSIMNDGVHRIILSGPRNIKLSKYKKVIVTPKTIKNSNIYQIEQYTETQVFHKNVEQDGLYDYLEDNTLDYKQLNAFTENFEWELKFNKQLQFIVNKRANNKVVGKMLPVGNNRQKEYIINEGMNIPVLVDLGVFTNEFKVVNSKYDKFKQINRFTELLADALKGYNKDSINIIDFGCGKSYLTFVIYYYLREIKGLKVSIIGLDLKADVIDKCNKLVDKYQYEGLEFRLGDINGFKAPFDVDMVVTLHACDTATDYALYNAITWNANIILSVPCCQHEINKQISSDNLSLFTKYGIIKERTSALLTDAIRGSLLEYSGYKTDLLEFIDIEHSPKNIMIRARKKQIPSDKKERSLQEVKKICKEFGLNPKLYSLLIEE